MSLAPYERDELRAIREKAEAFANTEGTNPGWVRAFLGLADAADRLDAMLARSSVGVPDVPAEVAE